MSAAVMPPGQQHPHRKPIPGRIVSQPSAPSSAGYSPQQSPHQYVQAQRGASMASMTTGPPSNLAFMSNGRTDHLYSMQQPQYRHNQQQPPPPQQQQQQYQPQQQVRQQAPLQVHNAVLPVNSRRSLSNATASTSSTGANLQRVPTNASGGAGDAPRRSTSSRSAGSTASPTSYVALMRKQKATVWCDRAQHEDPRLLAAQRALKERAAKEVAGSGYGRASTSSSSLIAMGSGASGAGGPGGGVGIRSKIRHHGAPKASTFTGGAQLNRAGVPMRLSASEVDDDEDEDDEDSKYVNYAVRNGGSMGSGHYAQASAAAEDASQGNGQGVDTSEDPTPVPGRNDHRVGDYFADRRNGTNHDRADSMSEEDEEEQRFGCVGGLPASSRAWAEQAERQRKTSEELRRRGSVDDRTMTMSGVGRLFVANPDLSD